MSQRPTPSPDNLPAVDPPARGQRVGCSILLTIGSLLAAFLLMELAVRAIGTYDEQGQFVFRGRVIRPYKYPTAATAKVLAEYQANDESYIMYDADLGWTVRPSSTSRDGQYTANAQGLRRDRDVSLTPDPGVVRIALFGDSYTYCDESTYEECFVTRLEENLLAQGYQVEVLNFGVPAYGMDQAYLRWKLYGQSFHPDIVVFGFQAENVGRNVNLFRGFENARTGIPFFKPRFTLEDGELVLLNTPTPPPDDIIEALDEFPTTPDARYEYWLDAENYRVHFWQQSKLLALIWDIYQGDAGSRGQRESALFDPDGEPVILTEAILNQWAAEAQAAGSQFIVVHIPRKPFLQSLRATGHYPYQELLDYVRQHFDYVETDQSFTDDDLQVYFGGHYSALGNDAIAEPLTTALAARLAESASP